MAAATAATPSAWFDKKVFGTVVIIIVILGIIFWYMNRNNRPAGSLTEVEYTALSATEKTNYQLDPKGSGYYVKKA